MRKIKFTPPNNSAWTQWIKKCDSEKKKILDQVSKGTRPKIGKTYQGCKPFLFCSTEPFYGKCAYCESAITSTQHGDVEHYRPKARVLDENDNVVLLSSKQEAHPGYYWLAFDWTNLLPSCTRCNQLSDGGKIGKGNRFPVIGQHAEKPGEEVNELPKLLNPMVDDPEDHFKFQSDGFIYPKSERGKVTIQLLGLNDRDLPRYRQAAVAETILQFNMVIMNLSTSEMPKLKAQMGELYSFKNNYSAFRSAAISDRFELCDNLRAGAKR